MTILHRALSVDDCPPELQVRLLMALSQQLLATTAGDDHPGDAGTSAARGANTEMAQHSDMLLVGEDGTP